MRVREKLLFRQLDLLSHSSSNSPFIKEDTDAASFITDNEEELLKLIRNYGKFNYDSINLAFSDIFRNEDDNDPQIDHETMYKCLSENCDLADEINANDEQIVVDFSANRRLLQDSIINITVKETKELIDLGQRQVDPPAVSPLDLSSSISPTDTSSADARSTKSSQTEVPAKKKRSFRPKITINNCNGIINLRNIANLTINCAKERSIRKEKSPKKDSSKATDEETITSTTKDDEDIEGHCEFYNRLLNEIKNSILLKKTRTYPLPLSGEEEEEETPVETPNEDVPATPDSTNEHVGIEKTADRKFVLKNFENLKIILESVNGTDLHPVQIEQWLAEIVSETEIEPNIGEIFEHSKLTS